MTNKRRTFKKGIILDPDTTALTEEGGVKYDDTVKKVQYRDNAGTKNVVSEDGTQTLENKTIDGTSATGNNTITADADNISYDNTTSGLTATNVKAALDEVQSNIEGKDEASEISYDNTTSGLIATNVQAAIDEVDGDLDTHIADTSAHGTTGNVVGTSDTQTLTNKTIDADSNTISNIDNADIKAAAAIDATKIADGSVDNVEFQRLNGVTSDIQTQLNNKLAGIGVSNDNRIIRNDGTSGNTFQESLLLIDDAGALSGATQLDVDNIRVDGNTISSTDTNGNVELTPDGTGIVKVNSNHRITGNVIRDVSSDAATGSNVTLTAPSTKNIRLTNASLASIDMIPAGTDGQEIVLINATGNQVFLNDSTGATAANQIKTGTQAPIQLSDEASIPLVYDSTESKWMVSAGVGGDSSGSLDIVYQQDYEVSFTPNATGNNASYLGGGSLNGSFSFVTGASALSGSQSLQYTAGASSNNDYAEEFLLDLDPKQRGTYLKIRNYVDMSNFSNDVTAVIYDKTNNKALTDSLDVFVASADATFYEFIVFVPNNCIQISYGFHVNNGAVNGETIKLDDLEISTNAVKTAELMDVQTLELNTSNGYGSTNTKIRRFSFTRKSEGSGLFTYTDSATDGMSITINRAGLYDISYCDLWTSTVHLGISKNSSQLTNGIESINAEDRLIIGRTVGNNVPDCVSCEVWLEAGDVIRPHTESTTTATNPEKAHFHISGRAFSEHIITPAKSNLTDWESYTPTWSGLGTVTNNLAKWRRVGDSIEIEASVQAGSPSGSINTSISIPSGLTIDGSKISSGSQNALGVFTLTEASTNYSSPSVKEGYVFYDGSDTTNLFLSFRASADGVMQKDVGGAFYGSGDGTILKVTVPITEYDSTATFLAAIPVQKTAYIKDVKSEGTNGGTFTSGSWQTRDLTTVSGDSEIVSLSSNQFTLPAGKYEISGSAPALRVDRHKARLRNITDSTTDIVGTSEYAENSALTEHMVRSIIKGQIEITESKTYEIQHRCQTTVSGNGFGIENNGFGEDEVYTEISITKIK